MTPQETIQQLRDLVGFDESDLPDDEISVALTQLILRAQHEGDEGLWGRVYDALANKEITSQIDVFATVPSLLQTNSDAALRMLDLIARECSAKELVIVLQEQTERLRAEISEESDDEHESEDNKSDLLGADAQTVRILDLYAEVIPRLRKGKRAPGDVVNPILKELASHMLLVQSRMSTAQGLAAIHSTSTLISSIWDWAAQDGADTSDIRAQLLDFGAKTLQAAERSLGADVASATFKQLYPRLARGHNVPPSLSAVGELWASLQQTGCTVTSLESETSFGSIILLAHIPAYTPSLQATQSLFTLLLASIRTNTALPSTLAFLLKAFTPLKADHTELPETLTLPLVHLLSHLAGVHPDQELRHIIFRVVALVLALSPPVLRMQLLKDIVEDEDTHPAMKVAVIGLVKEAVLDGLTRPAAGGQVNVFASPAFMRTFGPLVFRAYIPDVEDTQACLQAFMESPEPLRLSEVLGLYYVLLLRDKENRTGVRDQDTLSAVRKELLQPLEKYLPQWESELGSESDDEDEEISMRLRSLAMCLDLITSALQSSVCGGA